MNINLTSPINEIDDAIQVDLYINDWLATICLSFSGGLLLDATVPVIDQNMTVATGQLVLISDSVYSGLWVMGSVASPSAVPLTRHPSYPSDSGFKAGTVFHAVKGLLEYSETLLETLPYGQQLTQSMVLTASDSLQSVFQWVARGAGYFRFALVGAAVAPGGLVPGTWYHFGAPVYDAAAGYYTATVEDLSLTPVNITSTGTDDGGLSYIGDVQFTPTYLWAQTIAVTDGSASSPVGEFISLFSDGSLQVLVSSRQLPGGYSLPNTQAQAADAGTALGNGSRVREGGTAVGQSARAGLSSVSIGSYAGNEKPYAIAVGDVGAAERATALGRGAYTDSQIMFRGPNNEYRTGFEMVQLYLDSTSWSVASYPAKLYTSATQRTNMSTHSGWRAWGAFSGPVFFSGRCVVNFYDLTEAMLGYAVLQIEGMFWNDNDPGFLPGLTYQVKELYSSYPDTLTLAVTPSAIAAEAVGTFEVELSCTLPIASILIDAYMGVQAWSLHDGQVVPAAGFVTPQVTPQLGLGISQGLNF